MKVPIGIVTFLLFLTNVALRCFSYELEKDRVFKDSSVFSTTASNLFLLGTVIAQQGSRAILKNIATGEIKSYGEGEQVDLIYPDEVRVVKVLDCLVLIELGDTYRLLDCKDTSVSVKRDRLPTPLSRYKLVDLDNDSGESGSGNHYEEAILRVGKRYGVDPDLIKAIIKVESNFNPEAVSAKSAIGVMQLMPETAREYGVSNPFDPEENIEGGVRFLRDLIRYFNGDLMLVLAAYNAGKGAVIKYGFDVPPYKETVEYVRKVLYHYARIRDEGK